MNWEYSYSFETLLLLNLYVQQAMVEKIERMELEAESKDKVFQKENSMAFVSCNCLVKLINLIIAFKRDKCKPKYKKIKKLKVQK